MESDMNIGNRVQELRNARGISRRELAKRAALSEGGLYQIETGRREPSSQTTAALARALGVDPGVLFESPLVEAR
jgi:transcriptional regulator with XRE-family HTH domain